MKIGIVSVGWPPRHGGAMLYACRLAVRLIALGYQVEVATGSPAESHLDNGPIDVLRSSHPVDPDDENSVRNWYLGLHGWLAAHDFTHLLINAPLTRLSHAYATELYDMVHSAGAAVGSIHYDLGRDVAAELTWDYAMSGSWESAARRIEMKLKTHFAQHSARKAFADIESPCWFEPDFVVSCSDWSARFIDPLHRYPVFVLHPLMDPALNQPGGREPLTAVDISFVNPLPHKGADTLAGVVRNARPDWSFRVLKGGYGNGFDAFLSAVADSDAALAGRLLCMDYCSDMRDFYDATSLVLFPSLYEGYGMAAVEPMHRGVPVVARDYPAIVEGVGDGAFIVGYAEGPDVWLSAIETLLQNREHWSKCVSRRACVLQQRECKEIRQFTEFLEALQ